MKPEFIGIGAQKCATTWLYAVLEEHPEISLAMSDDGDKDTRFFSYFYDRGFSWYEKHFSSSNEQMTKGELSTSYMCSKEAPERVFNYAPEAKLLACLRHPIERAFSNHKHEIQLGRIGGDDQVFENAEKRNPMYLEQSLYHRYLTRWLEYFSMENILVVLVDDIESEPEETVKRIYDFLGVDDSFKPGVLFLRVHESKVINNIALDSSLKRLSGLVKKLGLGGLLKDFLRKTNLKSKIDRANSSSDKETFEPITPETRERLLRYFEYDNRALEKTLNRDLSQWRKYDHN